MTRYVQQHLDYIYCISIKKALSEYRCSQSTVLSMSLQTGKACTALEGQDIFDIACQTSSAWHRTSKHKGVGHIVSAMHAAGIFMTQKEAVEYEEPSKCLNAGMYFGAYCTCATFIKEGPPTWLAMLLHCMQGMP